MKPLAKFWTWIGQSFIPLAIGWAIFVRNGFGEKAPHDGVLISRGYWGLLLTLLVAATLIWALALYVRLARARGARLTVPPNTMFEDGQRSAVVSYVTLVVFAVAVVVGLGVFGGRYHDSMIHGWNSQAPLQSGFWSSRVEAHKSGCASNPCFAVGPRMEVPGAPVFGVNEYVLYLTDGLLLALSIACAFGLGYLAVGMKARRGGSDRRRGSRLQSR